MILISTVLMQRKAAMKMKAQIMLIQSPAVLMIFYSQNKLNLVASVHKYV